MNKREAKRKIDDLIMTVRCQKWMLEKCNHSHTSATYYPHHVRDRISESMVKDLEDVMSKLEYLANAIDKGITEPTEQELDDEKNGIPF